MGDQGRLQKGGNLLVGLEGFWGPARGGAIHAMPSKEEGFSTSLGDMAKITARPMTSMSSIQVGRLKILPFLIFSFLGFDFLSGFESV